MRAFITLFAALVLVSCAAGPTPERVGFDYPQAGLKFSPRRHVVSTTVRGTIASEQNPPYTLLFPRTTSEIESPNVRLLTTGIVGEWEPKPMPLYDEISMTVFRADEPYTFELTEEKDIALPWPGLQNPTGTLRVFRMTPVVGGEPRYTFAVLVRHYGNTIEFSWRDSSANPPDDEKMKVFFHWTNGLRFSEPETTD